MIKIYLLDLYLSGQAFSELSPPPLQFLDDLLFKKFFLKIFLESS